MGLKSVIIVLLFLISGCTASNPKEKELTSVNQIKYAKTLKIFLEGNGVKVHIYQPESKTYLFYFLSKDKIAKTPSGYTKIETPINSIIALSSTQIGMLSKIDGLNTIIGVMDEKYIYNPIVLKGIENGRIQSYQANGIVSFEAIVASNANILMYSGFGQEFPHAKQIQKAGTICMANYDWKENHPLGRAEWIKLFGYLIGKEKESNAYFLKIEKEYNDLKLKASKSKSKPSLLSGNVIGDLWFAPAGESYFAKLFKDANGNYLYSDSKGTGSIELSLESVISENRNSQYWLNPGYPSLKLVQNSNNKAYIFDAYKNKNTYCYSNNMNLFWEMSAIEPQHVLSDLICILHPELNKKQKIYFYKKLD